MATNSFFNTSGTAIADHVDPFVNPPFINAMRAPTSQDMLYPGTRWMDSSVNPPLIYSTSGAGNWDVGGVEPATTTTFGTVQLATLSELQNGNAPSGAIVPLSNDVATVIAGIVVGAVPPATETQQGIAELATQAETDAGTDDLKIVTPLKLATYVSGGSGDGSFVNLTATGTVSFTGATGAYTITSATASSVGTTGAGIDLSLSSASGSVPISAGEAVANAIGLQAAAGGIDIDGALQVNIASSQNAVDAVRILASAGGIDIDAVGAATEDINITNTGGSIVLQATESAVDSIDIISTAGGIRLRATGAAATEDISLTATGSSVVLTATETVADAIDINATTGGIDIDAAGQVNIATSQSAADSIVIESTAGGIDILASGAAGEDIDILATGSSVNISSTENAALAITLNTNGGTSETIRVRNQQGTGDASIELNSTAGGLTLAGGLGSADAVNITANTAGGGIDIDSSTGGFIVDTTGAFSIDGAAASNVTVTGAGIDLTLASAGGSVLVSSTEDAALAIRLHANGGTSETIQIHSDQGTGVGSIGLLSDVGGITVRATGLASDDAINLEAAAGGIDADAALQINVTSSQAAATAIQFTASDAAGGITATAGTGGVNLTATNTNVSGDLNLTSVATKISMNGGAATDFIGTATLVAGQATIANTNIAAGDRIMITRSALNGSPALGHLIYTINAGVSFVVDSFTDAGAAANTDVSSFTYVIIRQT